jgi:hypothetical protein
MAEAAPAVEGGANSFVAGVKEAGVEEAAEGEIIATMAGENFFAFSKKAFSSERVRPWESQPSPSQPPHHVHMKMQWPPRHHASKKGLSSEGEGRQWC